jgi:hypothetical protein
MPIFADPSWTDLEQMSYEKPNRDDAQWNAKYPCNEVTHCLLLLLFCVAVLDAAQ